MIDLRKVSRRPSVLALIAANLIPLGAVLAGGWSVFEVMVLFWLENVVIGLFNVIRILTVHVEHPAHRLALMGLAGFFTVHYGIFTLVHGIFVFTMFGAARSGLELSALLFPLLALIASHGISFALNWIRGGEYRTVSGPELMARPYVRVVILHLTILFGGWAVLTTGAPITALALLVVLKIGIDVVSHLVEHRPGDGAPLPGSA